jgi:hypothetical protein
MTTGRQAIQRSYRSTTAGDSSLLIDNQLDNVRESSSERNPLDGGPETGMISSTPRRARRREHGACSLEVRVGSRATTDDAASSYLRCDGIPQRYPAVVPASVPWGRCRPFFPGNDSKLRERSTDRRTFDPSSGIAQHHTSPPPSRRFHPSVTYLPRNLAETRGGTRPGMGNKFKLERTNFTNSRWKRTVPLVGTLRRSEHKKEHQGRGW